MTALEGEDPEKAVALLERPAQNATPKPNTRRRRRISSPTPASTWGSTPRRAPTTRRSSRPSRRAPWCRRWRYRMPLCLVFDGKYEAAIKELNDFILKNPDSPFLTDAKYRLMVCYFAAAVNDKTGEALQQNHRADAAVRDPIPGQPAAWVTCSRCAATRYAGLSDLPGQAESGCRGGRGVSRRLQGRAQRRDRRTTLCSRRSSSGRNTASGKRSTPPSTDFVKREPDHPSAATAKYWIGRALSRQRKDEEAKQFYATEIKAYMSQPRKDGVEMMINELVRLLAKRKKSPPASRRPPIETRSPAVTASRRHPGDPARGGTGGPHRRRGGDEEPDVHRPPLSRQSPAGPGAQRPPDAGHVLRPARRVRSQRTQPVSARSDGGVFPGQSRDGPQTEEARKRTDISTGRTSFPRSCFRASPRASSSNSGMSRRAKWPMLAATTRPPTNGSRRRSTWPAPPPACARRSSARPNPCSP